MGARLGFPSSRGHIIPGRLVLALCAAALLLSPHAVSGQYRLFGRESFRIGRLELGFGTDYLWELQKSLTISSSSGTVTVHDLEDGSTVTEPLGSDPRLLNRKFDIEWEMDGPGVLIPVSGSLGTGWGRVQTSFSLQVREGDFDLRFLNQREQEPDDSLHGRGTFYGAELGVAALCEDCPWFAKSGFLFQKLAGADAERSPSFASPGLQVLGDDTRLSRETRDAFARFGYSFSGRDIVTYTGVRHRWADIEVEDELRLFDPQFSQETTVRSRTKLDSSATQAIVGVEARRGSFIGRTEVAFNDEDYGILATVAYVRPSRRPPDFAALAAVAAPLLAELEAEFRERRKRLTVVTIGEGDTAYLTTEVEGLLGWTEGRLFVILHARELAPLRDSIRLRFRRFRKDISVISSAEATGNSTSSAFAGVALATFRLAQADPNKSKPGEEVNPILDAVGDFLLKLAGLAKERRFTLQLCVDSSPRGVTFLMWPPEDPKGPYREKSTVLEEQTLRGSYVYKLWRKGGSRSNPDIQCPDPKDRSGQGEPEDACLDLLDKEESQVLRCDLTIRKCEPLTDLPPPQKCPLP